MIKMEFSDGEFKKLIETVYLAEWVKNAHAVPDSKVNPYSLEQKIYKEAKAAGCGDWVIFDGNENAFFASNMVEEKCHGVLDEYNDETFWEELVSRLALRDIEEERGPNALEKMSPEDQSQVVSQTEEDTRPKPKGTESIGSKLLRNSGAERNFFLLGLNYDIFCYILSMVDIPGWEVASVGGSVRD